MSIEETIRQQIASAPVVLYMKGTPQMPQCGFSATVVNALTECGRPFSYVNILEAPEIRQALPSMFDWPTFPQLYVKGELIGGCDIIVDMHQNDELQDIVDEACKE